jgi:hypothetical protein
MLSFLSSFIYICLLELIYLLNSPFPPRIVIAFPCDLLQYLDTKDMFTAIVEFYGEGATETEGVIHELNNFPFLNINKEDASPVSPKTPFGPLIQYVPIVYGAVSTFFIVFALSIIYSARYRPAIQLEETAADYTLLA